jgi:hypothetical protein
MGPRVGRAKVGDLRPLFHLEHLLSAEEVTYRMRNFLGFLLVS